MDSETFYLCKQIIIWWDIVKDQYVEMPGFVQQAIEMISRAVMNVDENELEE